MAFHGKQGGTVKGAGKGAMRLHRQILREEADERNAETPPEKRRQARLESAKESAS